MKFRLLYSTTLLTLLSLLFIAAAPGPVNQATAQTSLFDRLEQSTVTNISLTLDLDQVLQNKNTNDYVPATFTHQGESWDMEVRVRGRFRRRVCDFPPLKLKFSKDMLSAAGLARHNKFKLVTHCSDNFDGNENILRENLAYELYQIVAGDGFRTQLVKVTYQDNDSDRRVERLGILIEDTDEMAHRLGGEECDDCYNLDVDRFAEGALEQTTLFQYMIGNTDWSAKLQRNAKLVQQNAGGQFLAVPYDFDFSGLVDTEYAIPNPNIDQEFVKDRVWQWEFEQDPNLDATVEHFLNKEAEILQFVDQYKLLSNRGRRQVTKYLTDFFTSLKDGSFQQAVYAQG